jgi:hypothetical protein
VSHDLVASFYGGYDQVGLGRPARLHIPRMALVIAVAVLFLLVFIAADVSAYESLPVNVEVTSVAWYAEGGLLTTSAGFSLHGSQLTTLTLSCSTVCYRIDGATVNSPFSVLSVVVSYDPDQHTDVTVRAPSSSYDGALTITLEVGSAASSGMF